MALPLPPASNLHAILLVTKSRSLGPRLVFHYPPLSPSAAALAAAKDPSWFRHDTSTASVDSHSSDSDWDSTSDSDDENDIEIGSRTSGGRGSGRTVTNSSHRERDRTKLGTGVWGKQETMDEDDAEHEDGEERGGRRIKGGDHDWDTVLGFKTDALEKMLSPNEEFNKRRFELGVESIVFVGAPMFVRSDGLWKKLKRKKKKRSEKEKLEDGDLTKGLTTAAEESQADSPEEPTKPVQEPFRYPEGFEPGYGHDSMSTTREPSEVGSDARSNSTSLDNNPDMTMFNVVFVLNPPALEYQQRVKEMYDNVTRKYAKALKYEEARFQYVWKESKRIIDIKQRAKESNDSLTATWRKIVGMSPLAKSIAIMFDTISQDKIAHIHFDATFNTSFQIPQADSTPYLPNAMEPQMLGLWLTTSNVVLEDDDAPMTQHAALLLLEDTETLIKDLGGDSAGNAAAIAFYIRNIVATKSLLKISKRHNILAQDMEYMASHLVYWRRARLISPLSPRDTYIVSPNADMTVLPAAITVYAQRFPTLPTLPKVLSMLSGTPRPFRTFIPTAEHRDAYMEILAWLMRGGWVTQLRTFAWIRVTPEIKAQVAAEMEHEELKKKAEEARKELLSDNESTTDSHFSDNKRNSLISVGSSRSLTALRRARQNQEPPAHAAEDMESGTILGGQLTASAMTTALAHYRSAGARPASDAGSASSQRTTIALNSSQRPESPSHLTIRDAKPLRPSPLHLKPTSPSRGSVVSPTSPETSSPPPNPKDFKPSTILSPQKASSLESRWLDKIAQTFEDATAITTNPSPPKHGDGGFGVTGQELKDSWQMLIRHLDGKHAIEDVSAREGIKRKRVAALFNAVREKGYLVVTRHW